MPSTKKVQLKIEHINSQSLQPNLDEIVLLLKKREVDILCISESWLLPIVQDRFINIPHFKIFRCDRGKGGGVCIYVRDELQVTLINTNVPEYPLVENIYLTIQYRKQPSCHTSVHF